MTTPETTPPAAALLSRRTVLAGFFLVGGTVVLAACTDSSATPAVPSGSGSPTQIEVTDNRGTVLTFNQAVTRVVTIPMPSASLIVAVDRSAQHLVGMHNASWMAIKDGILGQFFPELLKLPHDIATSDFTPNVESILDLEPDVVVQWSDSPLVEPLENAGLTVIGLTNNGTQEDVDSWVQIFATMLGKPERATEIKARSDGALAQVQADAAARAQPGPSILYFNRFTEGLKVAGANTYNDFYIKLVGGTNPATGDAPAPGTGMVGVDLEQVLTWNPEVILLGNFDGAMPDDIYSNPAWSGVRAVTNRRVYKVPLGGYRWDPPGQESPLMWTWLADIAFPSLSTSTLRAQITADYPFLYDHTPTDAQINTVLWMDVNDRSSNYQQFHAG
ncbi:ABC transporter substrate-binding protein [Cryobacterium melibiosiphilum]|uniref:ABC transporter substrate-binding protein n=1 Tax=Cryobacterium melibiosiphilum TaxID=995039 RepID=A0A3A5MEV2_9MICO|nr:ABC transporter substrate-binding protein [Cryobacterium melibiosiphilum]RJT88660.1 ABC transporter substrate-binding protein [Cryobacterium melibiosiphilum]RJT89422.1 ABC transporter substrate-binding protein [Cryobacterium melibiosiphilum]